MVTTSSAAVLTVTADDRTGAMEAAARCADLGWATLVCAWDGATEPIGSPLPQCWVVDLRSRHVSAHQAAQRAGAPRPSATWQVHKIDSTLRGNWAAELRALSARRRRVLVIPAYPEAGRICRAGVVMVDAVPVADSEFGRDGRSPVRSSRPAEALEGCEVVGASGVRHWLNAPGPTVAVADAATADDIEALVGAVGPEVVVAGPAPVVQAVARRAGTPRAWSVPGLPGGAALVVCASRHPASIAQIEALEGTPGVTVLTPAPGLVADPEVVALELATRAHDHLGAHRCAVVVVIGGDTADAFLGARAVEVLGSLGTGVARGRVRLGDDVVDLVTKPGGFGPPGLLVELLGRRSQP